MSCKPAREEVEAAKLVIADTGTAIEVASSEMLDAGWVDCDVGYEEHHWKYRVVYQGGDGATELYWTDSAADARAVARDRHGQVEGPLGKRFWGPK